MYSSTLQSNAVFMYGHLFNFVCKRSKTVFVFKPLYLILNKIGFKTEYFFKFVIVGLCSHVDSSNNENAFKTYF